LLSLLSSSTLTFADSNPSWQPPLGIPAPSFGIAESAPPAPAPWTSSVAGFYYIDAGNPASTDSSNPNGYPGKPRKTIPTPLPAGAVVELRGSYSASHTGANRIVANGTSSSPLFIRGASLTDRPSVTGVWEVSGSYFVVENIVFAVPAPVKGVLVFLAPVSHGAIRDCELLGSPGGGGMHVVSYSSALNQDFVVYRNRIHDNGDVNAGFDQDVHGIAVGARVDHLWVVDNEMFRNSGDGIQINAGSSALQATTHHIYVGRNTAHGNKQTGMWIKQAVDIVFSENLCYDHRPSNSSYGQCMGFQYATERAWFLFNHIHDSEVGIGVSSDNGLGFGQDAYFIGNVIHNVHTSPGTTFQSGSAWASSAIMLAGGVNDYVVNNTIYDVDGGVNSPKSAGKVEILDNVVTNVTQPLGAHVFLEQSSMASRSLLRNDLFGGAVRIKWGSGTARDLAAFQAAFPGQGLASLNADPLLVDPLKEDFRLGAGSPAVDAGAAESVYATFQGLYGIDIARDAEGNPRPQGAGWDMGALESGGSVLPRLQVADATVTESASGTVNAAFTVTLSPASVATVSVGFATADATATAGADYAPVSGTLTFAPGITSGTISVAVYGDTLPEASETFLVELLAPAGATLQDPQAVGTILDDDATTLPSLSIADAFTTEGDTGSKSLALVATLSSASSSTVTVAWATADGTAAAGSDYTASTGTLTFDPGTLSRSISVTVTGDTTVEADETFLVNLSAPVGATVADGQALGTILNDDVAALPSIAIGDVTLFEGNSGSRNAVFSVTLSAPSSTAVTVQYATADETALAFSDYKPATGSLTFPPGSVSTTLAVPVRGDRFLEPDETFLVNLGSPSGAAIADGQGRCTIRNDDRR
jgi:hypothetical protein